MQKNDEVKFMNDIISIIIPTFNRARSLPETIQSVLDQSASNWELIIVDDGSTDNTRDIVDCFLADRKIKYYFQENAGVSVARNEGVRLCRGDYLLFLDSDDQFFPGLISALNTSIYKNYDLICWQVVKSFKGKKSLWKPARLEKIYSYITATFLAGSICYKKEIFLKSGGFDSKLTFGENYELGMRISEIPNLKVKIINKPFLNYRISETRKSNSIDNRLQSYLHLYKKHENKFIQDGASNSNMNYLLGYVYEKKGFFDDANHYYKKSFKSSCLNYKAFLKIIFFQIFRR